MPFKQRA